MTAGGIEWRKHVEAVTAAIAVALLLKLFVLEISKIPSPSMQPTLIGDAATGVFDRVLVDKLSYRFRDPQRFEIVVFKHPLERSRIMVKRLVGMPGEELKVEGGDLWTRGGADEPWSVLRRPPAVREEMWRALDRDEPLRSSWSVIGGGQGWRIDGRRIAAAGDGKVRFRADQDRITDRYLDGYPDAIAAAPRAGPPKSRNAVGDLRAAGEIEARSGFTELVVELTEGGRAYRFHVPGPAAEPESRPRVEVRVTSGEPAGATAGEAFHLPAGRSVRFAAENVDDRLALSIDGEERVVLEVPPALTQEATVTLELRGEGAELEDLQVSRDIYYLPQTGSSWQARIPAGHYVVLGDNTQDSADSRDWRAKVYTWPAPEGPAREARGNFRPDTDNPLRGRAADGSPLLHFRDEWGEVHWIAPDEARPELEYNAPLVPRELLQGRALAVFWPLKPHRDIWRLAWLH